ncbi:MAG TPA: DUF6265 family protein, partial [Phycisphaerae bacterium]|nr:DUF6265 family protein [Phycisphaerae bacterium]
PEGGVMLGTSRLGSDAARTMYEFMLIEEKNGAPTMFLRHFRQYLGTTETQPMEFVLKKVKEGKAFFETEDKSHNFTHITYEREGKDTLIVRLKGSQNGKPSVTESRMQRSL